MKFYETLMLLRTASTESQLSALEGTVSKLVEDHEGRECKIDRWGRIKLAYPVEHMDYGCYVLVRYSLPGDKVPSFVRVLDSALKIKFNSCVIRYVNVKLTKEQFEDSYKRPESAVGISPRGSMAAYGFTVDPKAKKDGEDTGSGPVVVEPSEESDEKAVTGDNV